MKKMWFVTILLLLPNWLSAQDYSARYRLHLSDPLSYEVSCGMVTKGSWTVIKNSCNLYTRLLVAGGLPTYGDREIRIRVKLTNSGNLEEKDQTLIFYFIDDKPAGSQVLKGDQSRGEVVVEETLKVPARTTYRIRIAAVCDEKDEYWKISDGDLTVDQVAVEGEEILVEPGETGKLFARRDRHLVQLYWNAKPAPAEHYFRLEKSTDGKAYEVAGLVKTGQNNEDIIQHSFTDNSPFSPVTWYRLVQRKSSGEFVPYGTPIKVKGKE